MASGREIDRRAFLGAAGGATLGGLCASAQGDSGMQERPNLVVVFGDQWRGQATGYAGDPNARTPHLDRLAAESLNFTNAISGCPVCTPYRASLLTGQYWLTHGVFMNDVCLSSEAASIAEACAGAGYETAYIGKWHLDGHGRSSFIPRERRQGFDYWKVLECTHNYNDSLYYGDTPEPLTWEGYDAIAQTRDAQQYLRDHAGGSPFCLFLSWGPPHAPYHTAPEKYRAMFDPADIALRPNVPEEMAEQARRDLAGYYAHIAALDDCMGDLEGTLDETGLAENTVFLFTSDHGDMLYSQGAQKKQRPYEESIVCPFLLRYPAKLGRQGRAVDTVLNTPDIMPTLLGLCGVDLPDGVEGEDFSAQLLAGQTPDKDAALLMCPQPFGQWTRAMGGREYRGVRTKRYAYCRTLDGPWLLYDNAADPYQLHNRVNDPELAGIQAELEMKLNRKLEETNDRFEPGPVLLERWGYEVDETGTVPYAP